MGCALHLVDGIASALLPQDIHCAVEPLIAERGFTKILDTRFQAPGCFLHHGGNISILRNASFCPSSRSYETGIFPLQAAALSIKAIVPLAQLQVKEKENIGQYNWL